MRWIATIFAVAALAAAFALGRASAPSEAAPSPDVNDFRAALADPNWLTRWHAMTGFLVQLSPENLPAALEAFEPQLPWLVTDELRLLMLAWTRFDPAGALDRALAWPPQYRRVGAGAALYAWAFRDPAAALRAFQATDAPELRDFLEGRLVAGWAHGEQAESASDYIASLPESPRRFGYIGVLAWELAKRSPDAVRQWAEGVSDLSPRFKSAVFLKAAGTLVPLDPAASAAWVSQHLERGYADGALRVVARGWAASDPADALAWLATLPPGDRRVGAVTNAFRVWHDRAPRKAEQWLRGSTPAAALDPAIRVMVGRSKQTSTSRAIAWARALDDAERRKIVIAALEKLPEAPAEKAGSGATGDESWWESDEEPAAEGAPTEG